MRAACVLTSLCLSAALLSTFGPSALAQTAAVTAAAPAVTPEQGAKAAPAAPATAAQAPGASGQKTRRQVPDTLMFTIDELNEIKARIAGGDITKEVREQQAGNQPLYLNSIMYYGPKDWTIWINGSPIGPNQDFQSFQVTNITPRYVELLIPLSVQGMRPIRLEPNQTFISESGIVVEGRYP